MKINANDWSHHKKQVTIPIPVKCNVNVTVAAAGLIKLYGVGEEGEVLIWAAENHLHARPNMEGFNSLKLTASEFGMRISVNGTQLGEKLDQELPPVKPRPQTLVGRMHARAKETMAVTREAFENNTDRPGYEMEDDEPDEFEEEQAEQIIRQQQETTENAVADENTGDDPEPDKGDQTEEVATGG